MIFDKLFWLWFAAAGLLSVYLLMNDSSPYGFVFPVMLAGIGLCKLSEESRKVPAGRISRRILEKLKEKAEKE